MCRGDTDNSKTLLKSQVSVCLKERDRIFFRKQLDNRMKKPLTACQMANKLAAEQLKPVREYLLNGTTAKDVKECRADTQNSKESRTASQMASELAARQLEPVRKYLLD